VEYGDERVEVALAGRGEERLDDRSLRAEVGVRGGGSAVHATTGATGELPRCLGERSRIVAIPSNCTANISCSTNASRSGGVSGLGLDHATAATMVGHHDGDHLIATVYTKLAQRRAIARTRHAMNAYQQRQPALTPRLHVVA
jgi:hypothetical protein